MTSEASMQAAATHDYSWTRGDNAAISHVRIIDSGASGEVHEVHPLIQNINNF